MTTKEEVFLQIKETLIDAFDVDESSIVLSAQLNKDLDLDSIDAIDLVLKLQELTGKKVYPEQFEAITTIEDMVEIVYTLLDD